MHHPDRIPEPLFDHLDEVRDEIRAGTHLLLGLDFDGTLAPIVSHPEDACIPDETRVVLDALAARPNVTIAIVSGRSLADLTTRISVPAILAGNHGLEIDGRGYHFRHPQSLALQQELARICAELTRSLAGVPGSQVEDKGLTATVHFRNVADADLNKVTAIVWTVTSPFGEKFTLREGKKTFEILPRVAWNKGAAMRWIVNHVRDEKQPETVAACYIGDDVTDEDAFRTNDGVTIRVGAPTYTAARYRVSDPEQTREFLRWVASGM